MRRSKADLRIIALDRIKELINQADLVFLKKPYLANRYVYLARRMAMKYKVRLPIELKRKFCKHCNSYWKPGKTVRIRLLKGKKVYYCLVCKHFKRVLYKRKVTTLI